MTFPNKKPSVIDDFERLVSRFPGLGPRSARRILLALLDKPDLFLHPLRRSIEHLAQKVQHCSQCALYDICSPCHICCDTSREASICVVETVADAWALERANVHRGFYHVLGGTLNASRYQGGDQLNIDTLFTRLDGSINEIIIATGVTVEGQTTAHYLVTRIEEKHPDLRISRLAQGLPTGAELDYIDQGTLAVAVSQRMSFGSKKIKIDGQK